MNGTKLMLAATLVLAAMTWLLTPARPFGEGDIQPISAQDRAYFDALMRETWEPIDGLEEALALTRGRLRADLVFDPVVMKRIRYRDLRAWLHAAGDSGYGQEDPVYVIGILGPDIRRGDMMTSSGVPSIASEAETPSESVQRPLDGLFMAWHAESGDLVAGGALQDLPDPEAHLSLAGLRGIDEIPDAAISESRRAPILGAKLAERSR